MDEKRKRARARHYEKQGGKCYWCGQQMYMPEVYPGPKTKDFPRNLCTLEHMLHKYDRNKGQPGQYVAACLECNEKRGLERVKQEGQEKWWSSSGRYPKSVRLAQR